MSADNPFSMPRPATVAPGLTGQPPLPVGKPMILKSTTPGERAILEEYGWQEGQPVPENLGEIIRQAKAGATDTTQMAPPAALNTPKLQMPVEQDITQLPASEQARYRDIVHAALAVSQAEHQASQNLVDSMVPSAGSGVNEAIRQAMTGPETVELVNDLKQTQYDSGQAKAQPSTPPVQEAAGICPNCGWDCSNKDVMPITQTDKDLFLQSLLGGTPFVKTLKLFGDKLVIGVRTLTPSELDMCFQQRMIDSGEKEYENVDALELITRYRSALQVTDVTFNGRALRMPKTLAEWSEFVKQDILPGHTALRAIWQAFQKHVCNTETMHRTILGNVFRFNQLVRRLEDNASNPDFW
jgi:hypothetical protein